MPGKLSSSTAALIAVILSGCGTVMNLSAFDVPDSHPNRVSIFTPGHHPALKEIYGGVQIDAVAGKGWFEESTVESPTALAGLYVWFVDLPISAVADTLTLPITVPASIDRSINETYFPRKDEPTAHPADEPSANK